MILEVAVVVQVRWVLAEALRPLRPGWEHPISVAMGGLAEATMVVAIRGHSLEEVVVAHAGAAVALQQAAPVLLVL